MNREKKDWVRQVMDLKLTKNVKKKKKKKRCGLDKAVYLNNERFTMGTKEKKRQGWLNCGFEIK